MIVSNRSSTHVDKVKFSLYQLIEYHSTQPARFTRSEELRVVRKEAGGVDKHSEQRYEHWLDIPDHLPATRTGRGIINISYELRVEAKLAGWTRNLVETVPFVVASLPYFAADAPPPPEPTPAAAATAAALSEPSAAPAPNPATVGWTTPYHPHAAAVPHLMTTSLTDDRWRAVPPHAPTDPAPASAYPSLQSLPNPGQYPPQSPYNTDYVVGPEYAPLPAFQRRSHGTSSLRSAPLPPPASSHHHHHPHHPHRHNPSAPPLADAASSSPYRSASSQRSSISSSCSAATAPAGAPPSYAEVYGSNATSASSSASSSETSTPTASPAVHQRQQRARRKQAPLYPA